MSTRKPPAEKKRLAYQKDHIVNAEYPHAFRRQWPVKKAHLPTNGSGYPRFCAILPNGSLVYARG